MSNNNKKIDDIDMAINDLKGCNECYQNEINDDRMIGNHTIIGLLKRQIELNKEKIERLIAR